MKQKTEKKKYTRKQIQGIREFLADNEVTQFWQEGNDEDMFDLFMNGFKGYGKMTDKEVVKKFDNIGYGAYELRIEDTGSGCYSAAVIDVVDNLKKALEAEGYHDGYEYIIMEVPNIVDISYGRGVGYTFTQHDLGDDIHNISATKIRAKMREEGKLK